MNPQSSENFISIVPVFELLIELIRSSSIGDATIEANEPNCEILSDHIALLHLLVHYSCLGIMQKWEDHLYISCCNVRVGDYVLLAQ